MPIELGYAKLEVVRTVPFIKLVLNISSGSARTTCNFTVAEDVIRRTGVDLSQGTFFAFDGADELYRGEVESVDIEYQTELVKVATEQILTPETLRQNVKNNVRKILSQPPLNDSFLANPSVLEPLIKDLSDTERSKDDLIQECYRHNIIIDNFGRLHNIAAAPERLILGDPNAFTAVATINNFHHTPVQMFRGDTRLSRIIVKAADETEDGLLTDTYQLGNGPVTYRESREASSFEWADLYAREATRTIIRESAQLKITLPLNLKINPITGVNLINRVASTAGLGLWTVETVSHSVSGTTSSTTLNCKVLFENEKWRR